MISLDNIELWYKRLYRRYNPTDIYILHVKKNKKGSRLDIKKQEFDDKLFIKPLSNIKLSDIDAAEKSNQQIILYFDKQVNLTTLNILQSGKYRYLYYDLRYTKKNLPFHLKKNEPIDIVEMNILYIKEFITIFLTHNQNQKPIFTLTQINTLLFRSKKNITLETIHKDIKFLEQHNKLTSRLAIFIYKLCTFEFHASDKEIGLYFSNHFGKSKPLNKKSYGIQNVKGYDLNGYMDNPIYNTKVQIAAKLSNMQNQTINQDTILQATGIDINNV